MAANISWFTSARYGMFIHYGLFSMLERGEWVMNRERLSPGEMEKLAKNFNPEKFNAEELCDLALAGGMRYINLTTMHHEGFRLYDTELSDFNSMNHCGRDLVAEMVSAARERGLKVALYHSLNNWHDQPDGVAALESKDAYEEFIANTHARLRELATRFNPIDTMWYDGWWPFSAEGWQAETMNKMIRDIQPHILFNGRNGLDGDFGTPEGHMSPPSPWRPWEGCMTLNDHWGFHRGDDNWKSPEEVIALLATAACGRGNLLLNIGPKGDGSVPERSAQIVRTVGNWLQANGECIFDTDSFTYGLMERAGHNGDWNHNGPFTVSGKNLYQIVRYWPGSELVIAGMETEVEKVELLGSGPCEFECREGVVRVTGLPEGPPAALCPVLRLHCRNKPGMYLGGGMSIPAAPHPPYDPCPSDIAH